MKKNKEPTESMTVFKKDKILIRDYANKEGVNQMQLIRVFLKVIKKFKPELKVEVENIIRRR